MYCICWCKSHRHRLLYYRKRLHPNVFGLDEPVITAMWFSYTCVICVPVPYRSVRASTCSLPATYRHSLPARQLLIDEAASQDVLLACRIKILFMTLTTSLFVTLYGASHTSTPPSPATAITSPAAQRQHLLFIP